jgi:bacteriorhodopsin
MEEYFRLIAIVLFAIATLYFISIKEFISASITIIAGVAYVGMYMNSDNHLVYRYADWSLTTPLILFTLLTHANVPFPQTIFIMICDLLMIITGYLGKIEPNQTKRMIWYSIGMFLFIPIIMALMKINKSSNVALFTLIIWMAYPIVWIVSDVNAISSTTENSITAILDTTAKIGFGLLCRGCV